MSTLCCRYLASGDSMRSLSFAFLIAPSTVSEVIRDTCKALWETLCGEVFRPLCEETWKEVADGFWRECQFPNCLGCIDGKHCIVQVSDVTHASDTLGEGIATSTRQSAVTCRGVARLGLQGFNVSFYCLRLGI
jgi:hypothetical protein